MVTIGVSDSLSSEIYYIPYLKKKIIIMDYTYVHTIILFYINKYRYVRNTTVFSVTFVQRRIFFHCTVQNIQNDIVQYGTPKNYFLSL